MNEQFLSFMGLREDPFHVSPNPRFHYLTPSHETALAELMFGIESRQGIMLLTGEAGTGKTTLLNQILDWLRQRGRSTAFIFHTRVEPIGLLRLILTDFGVPCESKAKSDLVKTLHHWLLQRHAANDLPVLILDEAQALPPQTLNEIRLILNIETHRGKLLQIVLAGQPELEEKLQSPALRQLRQRIMFHSRLSTLTEKETGAYIARRLAVAGGSDPSVFPDEVVRSIHAISQGIPRVVNLLCEHALISACSEGCRVVSPEMIERIAVDFDLSLDPLLRMAYETGREEQFAVLPFTKREPPEVAQTPAMAAEEREAAPRVMQVAAAASAAAAFPVATPAPAVVEPVFTFVPDSLAPPTPPISSAVPDPVTPAVVPAVETMPDAPVVSDGRPSKVSPRGTRYWRKYRPKPAVAVFARRSISAVRGTLIDSARRVHHTLARMMEKARPGNATKLGPGAECPMQDSWMQQIEFDILENLPPRVPSEQAQVAVKESAAPVTAGATAAPSKTAVVVFLRDSLSSIGRACSVASDSVVWYFRSVVDSFVHDCRMFVRVSPAPVPVTGVNAAVPGGKPRPAAQRNALAVVDWLRQPIGPPRVLRRNATPPARWHGEGANTKRQKVANHR